MICSAKRIWIFRVLAILVCAGCVPLIHAADVTGRVQIDSAPKNEDAAGVVVSLTPLDPAQAASLRRPPVRTSLVQRDKTFSPHILVIPPGSLVDFPNKDPFFHNVFSLFEGKRFDLGLYESGASRSVKFEHPGVSYIFCNIHPQMNAIVISLDTPYYALLNADGVLRIPNVAAGIYTMQVWAEGLNSEEMAKLSRRLTIAQDPVELGTVEIPSQESLAHHKNKYGREYDGVATSPYEPH